MEISSSNIKTNPYIFSKERFSYISTNGTLQFSPQVRKIKKSSPKREQRKNFYLFWKESFSYVSGNGNPEKLFIFQEAELSYILRNPKKLSELEKSALATSFKNLLYIRRKFAKPENQNIILSLITTETFKVWLSSYIK